MASDGHANLFDTDGRDAIDLDVFAWAYRISRALHVGQSTGLFDALLEGAATAEELSERLELAADPAERLLTLLAATGLLYHQLDGRFRLTDAGREAFDPESPLYWGRGLAHAAQGWQRWQHLESYVRSGDWGGPPPSGGAGVTATPGGPGSHDVFVGAMHDYSVRGRAQWLAAIVDLGRRRRLLDLGGGPGTYSIALCERYPELECLIFDQPATEPIARANVERYDLAARIDFRAGDWNTDDYGSGFDAALLSNVLHGPGRGCEQRLAKVHDALAPGGLLIVQDFLLENDRNGPLMAAVFNLHVGAYSVAEMVEAIGAAGFEHVALQGRGEAGNGVVTGVKAG